MEIEQRIPIESLTARHLNLPPRTGAARKNRYKFASFSSAALYFSEIFYRFLFKCVAFYFLLFYM